MRKIADCTSYTPGILFSFSFPTYVLPVLSVRNRLCILRVQPKFYNFPSRGNIIPWPRMLREKISGHFLCVMFWYCMQCSAFGAWQRGSSRRNPGLNAGGPIFASIFEMGVFVVPRYCSSSNSATQPRVRRPSSPFKTHVCSAFCDSSSGAAIWQRGFIGAPSGNKSPCPQGAKGKEAMEIDDNDPGHLWYGLELDDLRGLTMIYPIRQL